MVKNKNRLSRFISGLWYLIGLIVAAALCFVGVLMLNGHFEGLDQPEPMGVEALHPGQTTDVQALSETFGLPLPHLPGYAMRGQALNVNYNGRNARKAMLQYDSFIITCVQPAFAAPLLLHNGLSLEPREEVTVAGLPAALASRDNAFCLYFNTDDAAFSLYAPSAGRESFLQLAEKITFTE